MKTFYTTDPREAAQVIHRGGIVAFPTETVYGLGANALDRAAVAKIFKAKQRPADNPLIAHVAIVSQINEVAREVTENARRLIGAFFPGPLTVVLSKSDRVPMIATAGLDTVGVRMPAREIAHRFIKACGVPIAAPSANLSGRPSPTTWQAVAEDLDGRVDCILQGDDADIGLESTVVDCTGEMPVLLRSGVISIERLREVVPSVESRAESELAKRSPGTRHAHYQPAAKVVLTEYPPALDDIESAAYIGLTRPLTPFGHQLICSDVDIYARSLFEFLRECDRRGIETIYCQEVAAEGIGAALMDRLKRAAG